MQIILITGANRGIGLALTRQLLQDEARIFATCRAPERAGDLNELAQRHAERVTVLQLDVNDAASIDSAVKAVAAENRRARPAHQQRWHWRRRPRSNLGADYLS